MRRSYIAHRVEDVDRLIMDLRLTRLFRVGRTRIQGVAELYNALNDRPAQIP